MNQTLPEIQVVEQELEPVHRFHDPITKTAWHTMSYSPDGDWLAGGAADPANHKIYIWDIQHNGQFTTTLDGGREPLVHVDVGSFLSPLLSSLTFSAQWHPIKPMIASTTNQGTVLVWHYPTPERWGAFAGGFEEGDENVIYEEREDEFDIVSTHEEFRAIRTDNSPKEDEAELERRKKIEEEQFIDIDTLDDLPISTGGTVPAPPNQLHARLQVLSTSRPNSRLGTPTPAPGTPNGPALGGGGVIGTPGTSGEVDEDAAWALDEPDDDPPDWTLKVVIEASPEY